MSTNISPSVHGKSWVFQVTALCIILGMLLALSLKTQRQAADVPNRLPALKAELRITKSENEKLRQDLVDYKDRVDELVSAKTSDPSNLKGIQSALEDAKIVAGTVPVVGPGVIVTLVDSPKRDLAETRPEIIERYIVHDYDIRGIVNELFSAGAEAVSVNGQRIVANSSIRCVGPVILINTERIAPPYNISAIGKPHELEEALQMSGGVAEELFLLDMAKMKRQEQVYIPAYDGSIRFVHAKPVASKK